MEKKQLKCDGSAGLHPGWVPGRYWVKNVFVQCDGSAGLHPGWVPGRYWVKNVFVQCDGSAGLHPGWVPGRYWVKNVFVQCDGSAGLHPGWVPGRCWVKNVFVQCDGSAGLHPGWVPGPGRYWKARVPNNVSLNGERLRRYHDLLIGQTQLPSREDVVRFIVEQLHLSCGAREDCLRASERDNILLLLTIVQLVLKPETHSTTRRRQNIYGYLGKLLGSCDMFISYSAGKSLMAVLQQSQPEDLTDGFFQRLVLYVLSEQINTNGIIHTLDLFRNILGSKRSGNKENVDRLTDCQDLCFRDISRLWTKIVQRFLATSQGGDNRDSHRHHGDDIMYSFLSLWAKLLKFARAKTCQDIADEKCSIDFVECAVELAKHVSLQSFLVGCFSKAVYVLNHSLPTASQLAMTHTTQIGSSGTLVQFIIDNTESLLASVPKRDGILFFGGTYCERAGHVGGSGTDVLQNDHSGQQAVDDRGMRGVALVIIKSCAIAISHVEESQTDDQLARVTKTLMQLKRRIDENASLTRSDHWLTGLFADQDDQLLEALLCLLCVVGGCRKSLHVPYSVITQECLMQSVSSGRGTHSQQQRGTHSQQQRGTHSQQQRGTHSQQQRGTHSQQQRGTHSQQQRGTHSQQQRGTHSQQQRGTHSQQQRGTHSQQQRGTHSQQQRGTHSQQQRGTHSQQQRGTHSQQQRRTHSQQQRGTHSQQWERHSQSAVGEALTVSSGRGTHSQQHRGTHSQQQERHSQSAAERHSQSAVGEALIVSSGRGSQSAVGEALTVSSREALTVSSGRGTHSQQQRGTHSQQQRGTHILIHSGRLGKMEEWRVGEECRGDYKRAELGREMEEWRVGEECRGDYKRAELGREMEEWRVGEECRGDYKRAELGREMEEWRVGEECRGDYKRAELGREMEE
ncbi:hypothetical protein LSAT2_031403 [Lamellibrachia satsuma]|nr:hypothetical protein LSAT2_031403 [Lamellibrachia satsuma]